MLLRLESSKDRVIFEHDSAFELKKLEKFPGLLKGRFDIYHHAPAKTHIIYNLVQRLKTLGLKLKAEKEVVDILNQEFKLRPLPEGFKFHTDPMDFQELALRYLYTVGSGGLLLDPGMGKSKVVLDYAFLMGVKTLVVCPRPLLFVWQDERAAHRPELTMHVVESTDWEKEKDGIQNSQVTVINYNKAVLLEENLKTAGFEFLHLDEFLIKDPKTTRTTSMTSLGRSVKYRCGGSGTLVNNSEGDIFAPVRYLEPALTGYSKFVFDERYGVKKVVKRGEGESVKEHKVVVAYKDKPEIKSILESCCIVMTKEKWLKLPPKVFEDISVPVTPYQEEIADRLLRNYTVKVQGLDIDANNPLVIATKLYQIANGFIYHSENPEEEIQDLFAEVKDKAKKKRKPGKRTTLHFQENPKVAVLRKLLTQRLQDQRAILWFNMEAEFQVIKQLFDSMGITYSVIKGGEKNTGDKVRSFNNDPHIKVLVCQAKSVNYGITVLGTTLEKLEEADYEIFPNIAPSVYTEIFWSLNFSLETYLQQQDRIHRLGQKHTCKYYRLVSQTAIEKRIVDALENKMSIRHDMLVDFIEKLQHDNATLV